MRPNPPNPIPLPYATPTAHRPKSAESEARLLQVACTAVADWAVAGFFVFAIIELVTLAARLVTKK